MYYDLFIQTKQDDRIHHLKIASLDDYRLFKLSMFGGASPIARDTDIKGIALVLSRVSATGKGDAYRKFKVYDARGSLKNYGKVL